MVIQRYICNCIICTSRRKCAHAALKRKSWNALTRRIIDVNHVPRGTVNYLHPVSEKHAASAFFNCDSEIREGGSEETPINSLNRPIPRLTSFNVARVIVPFFCKFSPLLGRNRNANYSVVMDEAKGATRAIWGGKKCARRWHRFH